MCPMCAVCDARLNQVPAAPNVGCKCKADTVDQSANGSLDCVLGVNPMICLQITHHSDGLQLLAVGCSEAGWGACEVEGQIITSSPFSSLTLKCCFVVVLHLQLPPDTAGGSPTVV
jgi:hypothetical protein